MKLPEIIPSRIAIKLKKDAEKIVKQGHPWVFDKGIVKQSKDGKSGDIAIIYGARFNKVIGIGLLDTDSPIRIKMLHHEGPVTIDASFFRNKIQKAKDIRKPLLETDTNSYRLIFGENDGLPSLIVDVYDRVAVVKLYSSIWFPYLEVLLPIIKELSETNSIVLRFSRKALLSAKELGIEEGTVLYEPLEDNVVVFKEHGVLFSANVILGHKTGYFLDHRENRRKVGKMSKGRKVLDVFSYAGGFSVHALANEATEVVSVDISAKALEMATDNGQLNTHKGSHRTIAMDAFQAMEQLHREGERFDVVVIDPPSFAKNAKEVDRAKKSYARLAKLAVTLVVDNGILVLASCSSRVSSDAFFKINEEALNGLVKYRLIEKTFHDVDHPIAFKEGAYLKCGYYKIRTSL